jgi:hypothetical protein
VSGVVEFDGLMRTTVRHWPDIFQCLEKYNVSLMDCIVFELALASKLLVKISGTSLDVFRDE